MENKKTIGIVGGGQLGRMLTRAAHKLGFKVIILDPTLNSPAGQIADKQLVGSYKDKDKILELGSMVDFLTFELEGINIEALEKLESEGKSVSPSSKVLKIIKDKFAQKAFLKNNNILVTEFALIENEEDVKRQAISFGYPFLLKARFDAFDGRGNFVIEEESQISEAFQKLQGPLYAEKFSPFIKELAIVCAKDSFGAIIAYPVVETVHKNNICHIVRSPAAVSNEIKERVENLANKVLAHLDGIGVFAIEMFLTKDGEVLVNEIAPRVHNSGHLTLEAFSVSQFEQHIRAITGMPLGSPLSQAPGAIMVNILGERDGDAELLGKSEAEALGGVNIHIYGKMHTRKERKMGHLTVLGDDMEETEKKALAARKAISI
jgi:phosphoribosylaminoimidazole carboxylase PurK protein